MREVVLDTETTGLDPRSGHRIVEIGCVELINHMATGKHFHKYLNPERDVPEQATAIHGLTEEFLSTQPVFADIAEELEAFIGDSALVIHNAEFDLGFINTEREKIGQPPVASNRAIDTVSLARRKFPGAQANLDALCRRFRIDNSDRTLHGALKDARLLAEVYLELIGGRQQDLGLSAEERKIVESAEKNRRPPRPHAPTDTEQRAHAQFMEKLESPIWKSED
ncbi:MAG: DNA polymerase III subunit epsilon [Rhodospirillaceae bacterium]|nr:DNA polymerase III subunit epsilon [Rhodospirillaceae bacterium]